MRRLTPSLIHRRGAVLWFRKSVPVELIDRLGSSDIRRSLHTSDCRVARKRAWQLLLVVEDAFEVLRNAGLGSDVRLAMSSILDEVIKDFDPAGRQIGNRGKYRALLDSLPEMYGAEGYASAGFSVRTGAYQPPDSTTIELPPTPIALWPQPGTPQNAPLDMGAMIQVAVERGLRDAKVSPAARKPLTTVISAYLVKKNQDLKDKKHLDEIARKLTIFLQAVGDKPIHQYEKKDIEGFRDLLDRMPKDAVKHLKTDDPRRAAELNARRAKPLPVITAVTVDAKYLSAIRGLFDYLVGEKVIATNPVTGIRSLQQCDPGDELLDVEKRLPFSSDHIRMLRANADEKPRWSADRWWIRIMCRMGLRDEELAALSVADFRVHHGRLCVDLLHLEDGDPINSERRKLLRLKTDAARRIIPVPKAVLDDGIEEFVEKRRLDGGPLALLFPNERVNKYGLRSAALSKRLNRQVDAVIKDPRYVAYSARHSFSAACKRAFMPDATLDYFMGHERDASEKDGKKIRRGRHVRGRYGSPIPSAEVLALIDTVKFD